MIFLVKWINRSNSMYNEAYLIVGKYDKVKLDLFNELLNVPKDELTITVHPQYTTINRVIISTVNEKTANDIVAKLINAKNFNMDYKNSNLPDEPFKLADEDEPIQNAI